MPNKIIWVFGPSAAGKETFIKHIMEDRPSELLNRLGWNSFNIVPCTESIKWVVQSDDDNNEMLRKYLAKLIRKYSQENKDSVILVKGQDLDFGDKSLEKAKEYLPQDSHEIVFLNTDFDTLYKRYKSKPWWDEFMTEDVCKSWMEEQIENLIERQKAGFNIRALNSGDDKRYEEASFPPEL